MARRRGILRAMAKANRKSNAEPLGFEATLWAAADKLEDALQSISALHESFWNASLQRSRRFGWSN